MTCTSLGLDVNTINTRSGCLVNGEVLQKYSKRECEAVASVRMV